MRTSKVLYHLYQMDRVPFIRKYDSLQISLSCNSKYNSLNVIQVVSDFLFAGLLFECAIQ